MEIKSMEQMSHTHTCMIDKERGKKENNKKKIGRSNNK